MKMRARPAAEAAAVVALILLIIWVIQPSSGSRLDAAALTLLAAFLAVSPWLHRDSRMRLGLRLDNLWPAVRHVFPASAAAAGAAVAVGYRFGTIDLPVDPLRTAAVSVGWAALQQYALQSVVLLRLEDAGFEKRTVFVAAALFSIVHAPNVGLMLLTFLGGIVWCRTFRRHPNLAALALSHGVLALVIVSTLPIGWTGGLRIGPAYRAG
jgi:hypothetical protein